MNLKNLTIRRAHKPDNCGGHDYSLIDPEGNIIAEVFEVVGFADATDRKYKKMPAIHIAKLFQHADTLRSKLDEAVAILTSYLLLRPVQGDNVTPELVEYWDKVQATVEECRNLLAMTIIPQQPEGDDHA